MHSRSFRMELMACWAFGLSLIAAAQSDSLKAVMAEHRAAMVHADSIGDGYVAFEARMRLAEWTKQPEAFSLLEQAAALADSLQRPDFGAMAGRMLAKRYAASGRYAQAYAESLTADSLDRLRELSEALDARTAFDAERRQLEAAQDSLVNIAAQRERAMAQAIVELQEKADSWMMIALAVLLLGLLLVAWLLFRARSTSTKLHAGIEALRKEVGQLKESRPSPTRVVPEPPSPVDEAMKPVVKGLFKQAATERLATLRDARQRGDTDKILRVVATLKPQLMAFDPDRFGPLITRLRASGAAANARQWTADLDALEEGVGEWSAQNGDR